MQVTLLKIYVSLSYLLFFLLKLRIEMVNMNQLLIICKIRSVLKSTIKCVQKNQNILKLNGLVHNMAHYTI